jgi:hypothetical protein
MRACLQGGNEFLAAAATSLLTELLSNPVVIIELLREGSPRY